MMLETHIIDDGVKARIVANSTPDPTTGCWVWNKRIDKYGYGKISVKYAQRHGNKAYDSMIASRVSYVAHKGEIPDGMLVCHTCDNRACVNPDHLYIGTAKDNYNDMVERGRSIKGRTRENVENYRKMALGRKRLYKEDGTWTWQYPSPNQNEYCI